MSNYGFKTSSEKQIDDAIVTTSSYFKIYNIHLKVVKQELEDRENCFKPIHNLIKYFYWGLK